MSDTTGEALSHSRFTKNISAEKFKWSAIQQKRLMEAHAELGTDWRLIQAIYFPQICFCALKNKFYRLQHDIPALADAPRLSQAVVTDAVPVPQLKYNFP